MSAEDEVYELRLQLAKTQVLLHEANAARHAAEQDLKRLRAAQPQTDGKERECQSLRSMLRAALDENVALQAQLAATEESLAELTASMQHQRSAAVALGPRQPTEQVYQAQQLKQPPRQLVKQQQGLLVSTFTQASSDTENPWPCQQQGQPAPQPLRQQHKEQLDRVLFCNADQIGPCQVEVTQPIHLLKAKLAEVAAAADVQSRGSLIEPSQSDLAGLLPRGEPQHTTLSVSGLKEPPAHQPPHQQSVGPGLDEPAASRQVPPAPTEVVTNGALPPTALQQVYKEISALQQRLKAAEEHFMVKAGLSRPASPAGQPRSRPLSPNHGPDPDWKLIRELKQRKSKVETMQLAASRAALAAALGVTASVPAGDGDGKLPSRLPSGAACCKPPAERGRTPPANQKPGRRQRSTERTPSLSRQGGWDLLAAGRSSHQMARKPGSVDRGSSQLLDPAPQARRNARRRSRSQQEEVSRLLMAGMSTSKNAAMGRRTTVTTLVECEGGWPQLWLGCDMFK